MALPPPAFLTCSRAADRLTRSFRWRSPNGRSSAGTVALEEDSARRSCASYRCSVPTVRNASESYGTGDRPSSLRTPLYVPITTSATWLCIAAIIRTTVAKAWMRGTPWRVSLERCIVYE